MSDWLIKTDRGWVEPTPPPCPCGSRRFLIGWTACQCGGRPLTVGHRTWECRDCRVREVIGCTAQHVSTQWGLRTQWGLCSL